MAIEDNFLGLSLEYDESLSQFQGITLELTENLIVKVVDSLGNTVDGAEVTFTIGQTSETALTQDNGTVGYLVEEESTVTISAQLDCLFSGEVDILHGGIDDFRSITLTLQELPCLEPLPSNKYNFYRWQFSNNLSFPLELPIRECVDCNDVDFDNPIGIQRPLEGIKCGEYLPVMIPGETYAFFTNFIESISIQSVGNLKVGFIRDEDSSPVISYDCNVNTQSGLTRNFWAEFKLGNIENDNYRMVIYNSLNNQILFFSNYIEVNSNANKRQTALIKWRNNDNMDGFLYNELPEFYNKARVHVYQDNARTPEPEFEDENLVTSAEHRYISYAQRLGIPVLADDFDYLACEALESLIAHSEIYINGKRYNPSPDSLQWNQKDLGYNRFDGNFVIYDYDYARRNPYQ